MRILLFILLGLPATAAAQQQKNTDSFDVFTYYTPAFFIKSALPARLQLSMKNNDSSFCLISLYKSQQAQQDIPKDIAAQWNEYVVKPLSKADKKPARILTQQMWDGWASTLAIGNCRQNNKKCVVMLSSFRKGKTSACAVYLMSDKTFKQPVEQFSQQLHLKQ